MKPDGEVGLIDFERTRVDFQCLDSARLWMREWHTRGQLRNAFFEGYGHAPSNREDDLVRLLPLYAVGGVVWSIEHGDQVYAEEDMRVVERLRDRHAKSPGT